MDMEKFEQMAHDLLKDAEQKPPQGVWEAIDSRLSEGATPTKGTFSPRMMIASAVAFIAVAGIVFWALRNPQQPQELPPVLAEAAAQVDSVVSDNDETPVVPTVSSTESVAKSPVNRNTLKETETLAAIDNEIVVNQTTSNKTSAEQKEQVSLSQSDIIETELPLPNLQTSKSEATTEPVTTKSQRDTAVQQKPSVSFVVPNLLSPNGDGYNDCWVLPNMDQYGTVQVQIYTAKSQRVFISTDYHNDFCGDDLPDGNYFYVLNFRDLKTSRRGVLVIKR